MKVKGTWFLPYVQMIRANKARKAEFDDFLQPQDWEIINNKVLVSSWYPFESYRRMGEAVFRVLARGDLQTVQATGQGLMREMLKTYKNMVVANDPIASLGKLLQNQSNFFRNIDSMISFTKKEPGQVEIQLAMTHEFLADPVTLAFAHQIAGKMEELISQAGGKHAKVEVKKNPLNFAFHVTWQ